MVLALERAAVMTTRFMMLPAKGMLAAAKANTNGLPVTPLPMRSHGVMDSITIMDST